MNQGWACVSLRSRNTEAGFSMDEKKNEDNHFGTIPLASFEPDFPDYSSRLWWNHRFGKKSQELSMVLQKLNNTLEDDTKHEELSFL